MIRVLFGGPGGIFHLEYCSTDIIIYNSCKFCYSKIKTWPPLAAGKELMERKELLKYVGSMQQEAYIRRVRFEEGRSEGMAGALVKNGPLQFTVMMDKSLDIGELSFQGIQMNFLSKAGFVGHTPYETRGKEAQRSIMGGMFFTCGLENIGPPCEIQGSEYPMHGRMRTTPGEHLGTDAFWNENGQYEMVLKGEMREAELFGENLLLRREIRTVYGEPKIQIKDSIYNEGFREEPYLTLYHFNMGYPLLDEDCEIILPTRKVIARDEDAAGHEADYWHMGSPVDEKAEEVFFHELAADENGMTFAAAFNKRLGVGLRIDFSVKEFPYFIQWKSPASGDYAMGLEPANADVRGRNWYDTNSQKPPMIGAQEEVKKNLTLTLLKGAEALENLKKEAEELKK